MLRPLLALALSVLVSACAGAGAPRGSEAPVARTAEEEPVRPHSEPPAPPPPAEPRPVAVARLTSGPRGLVLVVEARGPGPVRLSGRVDLEREGASGWTVAAGPVADLRSGCGAPPDACIELVEGAEARVSLSADAASGSARCPVLAPGRYRAVLHSCGGQHTIVTESVTR